MNYPTKYGGATLSMGFGVGSYPTEAANYLSNKSKFNTTPFIVI